MFMRYTYSPAMAKKGRSTLKKGQRPYSKVGEERMEKEELLPSSSSEEEETSGMGADEEDEENEENNTATKAGFTDENATWLKPKTKGLLDSDEEDESEGSDSDTEPNEGADEDSDDDDDMLDVEQEAEMIDQDAAAEEEEAEEEMKRTIRDQSSIYHLPTAEELEKDVNRVVPPSEIKVHIESILEVLAEFKARREPGRSRQEYVDQLGNYIAELHGYIPELVHYFLTMFTPAEAYEFVIASDKPRPLVIRTNTLKTRRKDLAAALIKRGVSLDPLDTWSKVGLKIIDSPVPIGATPEYLTGHYMLQSAASMCPVMALSPQPKEKVLDMSAAPGGKTSYLAQLMRNTGVILANDLRPERQKATVANLHRLGVKNVVTCARDGRKLGFSNQFDRILLDAPCSGLGVISRDPSVKVQRTIADVQKNAHLQKELLLSAIDALKFKNSSGCVMVYSTCSISVYENEEVVDYAMRKRDIQVVDTGLAFGNPGFTRFQQRRFHPSIAKCRRFYPHTVNMDGFFVCKIRKLSDRKTGTDKPEDEANTEAEEMDVEETEDEVAETEKQGKPDVVKKSRIAVPPKKAKKKQRQNAKVTKPRRWKMTAM